MTTMATPEQVAELAATAKPYSMVLLWWTPERHMEGAEAIEGEHQRRMVGLRADGAIAILCPVGADDLAGVAVMDLAPDEAERVMGDDPCVRAGMMRVEVRGCGGFPGDSLP